LEETLYHVVLEGRRLGPYDRRTIVGMRVRKTLTSTHVLECTDGARLTVAELLRGTLPASPPPEPEPEPPPPEPAASAQGARVSSYSVIQATHAADLLEVAGPGYAVPAFKGEVEVRVQTKVLRLAGRFRDRLGWKEDRVKFPLQDIIHARLQGSIVELGVRPPSGEGLQRLRLDLRTPQAACELAESLPHTVPWPGSEPLAGASPSARRKGRKMRWSALAGGVLAMFAALAWVWMQRA